jgi:hypothetical protein
MYLDSLKSSNPSNHMFVTTFNKLSSATSPTRQAVHQDADSTNAFPSPPGTQHNGYHCFLRREYLSMWISVATHLFQLAQNNFSGNFGNLLFLAVFNFRGHFEGLNECFWDQYSQ